jgi:SAM-dependent methyltransferase
VIREFHSAARQLRRTVRDAFKAVPGNYRQWRRFWEGYRQYQRLAPPEARLQPRHLLPCLGDDTAQTEIEPIYFYQDAWAFEKIVQQRPPWHVDVGSHHKFVALLSKVVPLTMVDLRPLSLPLESLKFQPGSILALPFADRSVPSVSSLCVIEHIGLGRYGDALDPRGTEKAAAELQRIVQPGGLLYVSAPLDDENRIYFNGHRAFTEDYLLGLFRTFDVLERRYIFGKEFGSRLQRGFGTGCYHLRAPA